MNTELRQLIRSIVIGLLAALLLLPALALAEAGDWSYQLAPLYLWGQNTDGTAVVGDQAIPIKLDFSDAVNFLDGGFSVHFEAWKGDWGLLLDYFRIRLAGDVSGQFITYDLGLDESIVEAAGGWRFGSRDLAVLVGIRSYDMKLKVRFEDTILPIESRTVGTDFLDGFAGVAWSPKIGDRWSLALRFDAGMGDSDLVLNASAFVSFRFTDLLQLYAGYRYLDYDVSKGSGANRFEWDVQKDGFVLALAFNF